MKLFARILLALFLFAILASIMGGCQWHRQRMQKKYCIPTPVEVRFDTIIKLVATTPGDSGEVTLPCQEFKALYDSLLKAGSNKIDSNGYKTIFENKKTALKAKPNANGSIDLNVVDKGDSINKDIPITIIKEVPCNCPEPAPEKSLLFWKISLILMAILCILAISR